MKILFVKHRGSNVKYLTWCLEYLAKQKIIELCIVDLDKYLSIEDKLFDITIYQTFPGEIHPTKFKAYKSLIDRTDNKFLDFKGKKILFDAHASGLIDGFSRFNDKTIPRIKNAPHKDFMKEYNVICPTTYPIDYVDDINKRKDIDISYCVSMRNNRLIRTQILEILKSYKGTSAKDFGKKRFNSRQYIKYLGRVWISVNPPGWGEGCFRHLETLNAKSLVLAFESIRGIKLLPNAELIEDQDYVIFSYDNLTEKLDYLLDNRDYVLRVSKNGYEKFREGFSICKSASQLLEVL